MGESTIPERREHLHPATLASRETRTDLWVPPDPGPSWLDAAGERVLRRLPRWSLWGLAALGAWTVEGWIVGLFQ